MEKLKPCPWCSATYQLDRSEGLNIELQEEFPRMVRVACECGASGPLAEDTTQAVAAWNRRASDAALAKAREALEAADNLLARGDDATRQERGLVGLTVINVLAALKEVES